MKILYLNALYAPMIKGGAEISLKLIVEGMQARGYEVVLLSMTPNKGLTSEYVDGVKVYRAELKNAYWPFTNEKASKLKRMVWHFRDRNNTAMRSYLREVLLAEKPDVVSCHNLVGWSVAVWDEIKSQRIPIVQVLHDMYLLCPNSEMYKSDTDCNEICLSCKLLRSAHQKKSQNVNAVVGISKSILNRFEKHGYFSGVQKHVILNTRSIPDPGSTRKRKAGTKLRIGYFGTLLKKKGIEWLIQSFRQLQIDATLIIGGVGQKDYESELRDLAKGSRIEFIGHTNPADFYPQIDVLVVPSLWQEPLGMVAIEALGNHIPVIANQIGGLQETVQENVNGLFCTDQKPESLTKALLKLYNDTDLYNQLSGSARASVASILDSNRMLDEYEKVMKSITEPTAKHETR
ncbi:MAG: glycosyltransferase family 4 protein [Cyclobacteriaceae bacterium]